MNAQPETVDKERDANLFSSCDAVIFDGLKVHFVMICGDGVVHMEMATAMDISNGLARGLGIRFGFEIRGCEAGAITVNCRLQLPEFPLGQSGIV